MLSFCRCRSLAVKVRVIVKAARRVVFFLASQKFIHSIKHHSYFESNLHPAMTQISHMIVYSAKLLLSYFRNWRLIDRFSLGPHTNTSTRQSLIGMDFRSEKSIICPTTNRSRTVTQ